MRRMLLIPVLLAFCLGGCEDRTPISRAVVVSNAHNLQVRDGLAWGEAIEVLAPASADEQGKSWWQVRYHEGADGSIRILLVDGVSGWVRHPPAGYIARLPPPAKISGEHVLTVAEGSHIVVLVPAKALDADGRRALDQEALRLNALATNTGLTPLFSVRELRDQQVVLVYGWKDDHGIAREPRVIDWLNARTPYLGALWEDLVPRP